MLWFPRQTLDIVSLPLVYHIEKFLFNYTNIKQELGQKKSFYYDSSICCLLFEIFQVSFFFAHVLVCCVVRIYNQFCILHFILHLYRLVGKLEAQICGLAGSGEGGGAGSLISDQQ